jgi:tellurite resistance protein
MSDPGSDGIRRVSSELEALPFETRRFVSVYAYVLARVARIDPGITDAERDFMERAVSEVGELSGEQAALVVQIARSVGSLYGATEDYVVTREFASLATSAQCQALLRTAFAVSAADGHVSESELAELQEIGMELGMEVATVEAIAAEPIAGLGSERSADDG